MDYQEIQTKKLDLQAFAQRLDGNLQTIGFKKFIGTDLVEILYSLGKLQETLEDCVVGMGGRLIPLAKPGMDFEANVVKIDGEVGSLASGFEASAQPGGAVDSFVQRVQPVIWALQELRIWFGMSVGERVILVKMGS